MTKLNIDNSIEEEKNIEKNQKPDYSISFLVQKILEHSYSIDKTSETYEELSSKIKLLFYNRLKNIVKINDVKSKWIAQNLFFSTYLSWFWEGDDLNIKVNKEKVFSKVEKNLIIYLPIIIEFIQKDIEKNKIDIISIDAEKIIKEYIKKILIILLIYWEKIDFNLIRALLKLDLNELKEKQDDFLNNVDDLDWEEDDLNLILREWYQERKRNNIYQDEILKIKPYEDYFLFSSAYRVSYKRAESKLIKYQKSKKIDNGQDKKEKFDEFLKESLEDEINIAFIKLYNLFLKTIKLNVELDLRLEKISNAFLKLFIFINKLSEKDLAYHDLKGEFNLSIYITSLLSKIFNLDFKLDNNNNNNNLFLSFLNLSKKRITNDKFDFTELKYLISKQKQKNIKYSTDKINKWNLNENISIDNINIDIWEKLDIDERYKIFLNQVFITDKKTWYISFIDSLNFDYKNIGNVLEIYSELSWTNKKVMNNQFNDINTLISWWINLESFIEYDINNVLTLYEWWRFQLFMKKYDWKITKENAWKYKKYYSSNNIWLSDLLIKELNEKNLLDDKLDINPDTRLYNMSVDNIWLEIDWIFKWLSKWSIDIKSFKIWTLKFWEEFDLFCHSENSTYEDTFNYINMWIDVLKKILQWKTSFIDDNENNYIKLLKKYKIISNLDNLKEKNKNNLALLIERLKIVKSRASILNKMFKVADEDSELIKEIFWDLINSKSNDFSDFWVSKKFWRALIKLITYYNWDFHKIWDLTRLRIAWETYDDVVNLFSKFIKIWKQSGEILNIWILDKTWHLLSFSKLPSWYRDLKVFFTLKSWNIVEFQFHFLDMINAKDWEIEVTKDIMNKLYTEESLLSVSELYKFIEIYIDKTWLIPWLELLENISWYDKNLLKRDEKYIEIIENHKKISRNEKTSNNISWDLLYYFRRNMWKNTEFHVKLTRLERILFENAWKNVIKNYIRDKKLIEKK